MVFPALFFAFDGLVERGCCCEQQGDTQHTCDQALDIIAARFHMVQRIDRKQRRRNGASAQAAHNFPVHDLASGEFGYAKKFSPRSKEQIGT